MKKTAYFWDSCTFIKAFDSAQTEGARDAIKYLQECQEGRGVIYTSSLVLTEVLNSQFPAQKSISDFLEDFNGIIRIFDANANICNLAGQLRDIRYEKDSGTRILTTPDAIFMATALFINENSIDKIHEFHSFDMGRTKDIDGKKTIPIVGYETWCTHLTGNQKKLTQKIIDIKRCKPIFHSPGLFE